VGTKELFQAALIAGASFLIVGHNLCASAHKLCYGQRGFM
jgi:hypothetical protein